MKQKNVVRKSELEEKIDRLEMIIEKLTNTSNLSVEEVMRPVTNIEIKEKRLYRSRDGRKIMIWYANKLNSKIVSSRGKEINEPYIGMIEDKNNAGVWRPGVWLQDGSAKRPLDNTSDIIANWKES